jgi:hypothetical protein
MRTQTTNLSSASRVSRTSEGWVSLRKKRVNDELTERLVNVHEDIFFYGDEFAIQRGWEKLPDEVLRYYFGPLLGPRRPARQLRSLSRVGRHPPERAAQEPAASRCPSSG